MSYQAYTHLIYGVLVTNKQAQKLYDAFCDEDEGSFIVSEECQYPIELRSDGTDGRAEDIYFEPGFNHYFGIIFSEDSKTTNKMIKKPPTEAHELFEQYVLPVLKQYKINLKPDFYTFVQTL